MSNEKQSQSSLGQRNEDPELVPDATPNAVEELKPTNEERSLNIGESGQFAPGGRYNELGVTAPRRIDLDDQVDSALNNENK